MKKLFTSICIGSFCAFIAFNANAQNNSNNNQTTIASPKPGATGGATADPSQANTGLYNVPIYKRPLTVSASLGTNGIGVSARLGLSPHWRLSLGYNYTPINYTTTFSISSLQTSMDINIHLNNIHLFGEWRPFTSTAFRLVGGIAYFMDSKMNINVTPTNNYYYGLIPLTPATIGKLYANLDYSGIAPYFGFGIFKGQPAPGKFAVNMDFGTYVLSSPRSTITGTNLFADPQVDTKQLDKNIAGWRWLPIVQVNVSYRIKMGSSKSK
ncbi:MAG: hypothetical protein WCG87_10325 [Bacteroidota bacterium]